MQPFKHWIYSFAMAFACMACTSSNSHDALQQATIATDSLLYAQQFSIAHTANYSILSLHNPWKEGEDLATFYVVTDKSVATPNDHPRLVAPLSSVCIQSAPHIGFIEALQQTASVTGAASPQLLYSPAVRERYQRGEVSHLGDAYQLRIESIVQLQPHALFTTAYPQEDPITQRLQAVNVPVIPTAEWAESSLLARAEWIKVYGLLWNCSEKADSIFNQVAHEYEQLRLLATQSQHSPSVMSGLPFKDTWYMPGGNSFMGQLFQHAHLQYYFSKTQETASLPLSFETVWYYFNEAELWVGIDATSYQEVAQMDKRLSRFNAIQTKNTFHYKKRITPDGGNDFWESAMVYPNRLLHDLIKVAHPHLLPNDSTFYIDSLQ